MMRHILLTTSLLASAACQAHDLEWENPHIFGINKLPEIRL